MSEQESIISKKRKEEIGVIIQKEKIEINELDTLTIQETIFVIRYYQYCNENNYVNQYKLKKQILIDNLIKKMQKEQTLYGLIDKKSQFPYFNVGCLDLFSQEKLAKEAIQHYEQQGRELEINKMEMEERRNLLLNYYIFYGFERVRIDMGGYSTEIDLKGLLNIQQKKETTANPKLRLAMLDFIEERECLQNFQNKVGIIQQKENIMRDEMKRAHLLMPVHLHKRIGEQDEEHQNIQIAGMKSKQGESFIPVFTDWLAFQTCYDSNIWNGMLVYLKEIKDFSKGDGIVINPQNENISVSYKMMEEIIST